jgi:hypothetical protein
VSNYRWKREDHPGSCTSCKAADGQVHPMSAWEAAGITPGASRLMCGDRCTCALVETSDPESGDISSIPLRTQEQTMPPTEQRLKLTATGAVNAQGEFEIFAITAGQANGWSFSADLLRRSLPLWNGAHCFIDHSWYNRSLRDLAGVCYDPEWDDTAQGIKLKLRTSGPSGPLLSAIGREMIADGGPKAHVGFSADITFTANGKDVQDILRVYSLDSVYDPARGGAFIRALNQSGYRPNQAPLPAGQESLMPPQSNNSPATDPATAPAGTLQAQLQEHQAEIERMASIQAERTRLADEVSAGEELRRAMCSNVLNAELTNCKLPGPAVEFIREQFSEPDGAGGTRVRLFKPLELSKAIDAQRSLVAQLRQNSVVQGPGRVGEMYNTDDQVEAAFFDMLGAERDPRLKNVKVARLSGIREAYLGFTADHDFTGAVDLVRAMFQHTTATFPSLVKNAMNKIIATRWDQLGRAGYDWWQKIATVEHLADLKTVTWIITGTVGDLPTVAEGAEYTELQTGDGEETSSVVTYGGYVGITRRAIINDETRRLRNIPITLANAGMRKISRLVAAIFTDNSAVGPTLADGGALFNSTAVTTLGGHANLLTTALGTTYAAWEAASTAIYNQPMLVRNATGYYGTGDKQALDGRYILVPRALRGAANDLFIPRMSALDNKNTENLYEGTVFPLTIPEWTDATDWAAVADPLMAPGVMIGEPFGLMPSIFIAGDERDPAMFANDEARVKVRHELAVGVADFRPLHKSNVA